MVYFLWGALLALVLVVVIVSRTSTRLLETFLAPPIDLATNKQFQAFLTFHGTVCDMWNEVIQKAMDSDQTTLSKADYIRQLEPPNMAFIQCAATLTATTDPATLLQEIPTTMDPYRNTLTFLITKTTDMITKLEGGLHGITEQFAPFQATVTCANGTCTGPNITCTATDGTASVTDASGSPQALLQQVLDRIGPILEGVPDIQTLYTQAQANIAKLKEYSEQAQNGTLVNQVSLPSH